MRLIILLCLFCFAVTGCGRQDVKNSWKYTIKQYRAYLNTPAKLDLDYQPTTADYENVLVESVFAMDSQLEKLVRAMENSAKDVGPEWVSSMMNQFPWLSGLALADNFGQVISHYPEYSNANIAIAPLLEEDPKQPSYALRAYVNRGLMGNQIYVASPVYIDEELRGLVVAFFDPKALLTYAPDPGIFAIASSSGLLWSGNFDSDSSPVASADWEKIVLKDSKGYIGKSGDEFYWIARYIGNLPIVYALPVNTAAGS